MLVFAFYFTVNLFFTFIYILLGSANIQGMLYSSRIEKFWEVFFFSAQTLTTVGYGRLNPAGIETSTLAAIESLIGLMGFALATGLLYGRFSRPTAKIIYSVQGYKIGDGIAVDIGECRYIPCIAIAHIPEP